MNSFVENFKEVAINFFTSNFSDFLSINWFVNRYLLILKIALISNLILSYLSEKLIDNKKVTKVKFFQRAINNGLKLSFVILTALGGFKILAPILLDFNKNTNGFTINNLIYNIATFSVVHHFVIATLVFLLALLLGKIFTHTQNWNMYVSEDYEDMVFTIFKHYILVLIVCKTFGYFFSDRDLLFFGLGSAAFLIKLSLRFKEFYQECL